ncbi:S-layer homology domain-containing protein [Alkaliphilus pronyensis]|uniref:S-layer homology domain-containing protein n=1 Tax=Alkaliphilus pronyensis TaxID=1482732 RepID=A0A6I0EZB5_9FIRM|nr:S-layer homology domain-containing protein [Alkaliphilus pronyensis]KAB3534479.1 S-layer homology domain-containing protein [Alkaliphilus pronyensis]
MKKIGKIIIIIAISVLSIHISTAIGVYNDIDNHWSKEYVNWATNTVRILDGFEDGSFRPDESISRIDFALALDDLMYKKGIYSEAGLYSGSGENIAYKDIDSNHWAYGELALLATFISDYSDTDITFMDIFKGESFNPNSAINRYEVLLLTRAVTTPPIDNNNVYFIDVDNNTLYYDLIIESVNNGILKGYSDETLRLDNNITRAEAATVLKRVGSDLEYFSDSFLVYKDSLSNEDRLELPLFQSSEGHDEEAELHQKFIDAVTSIHYSNFVGHIPYDERHLYDMTPIETLWELKNENYFNVIGNNYYLIKYDDSIVLERKVELMEEGLQHLFNNMDSNIEGLSEFLSIASEYVPIEDINTIIETTYNETNNSQTKLETGLYSISNHIANEEFDEGINAYKNLIGFDFNNNIKSQLIRNYGYLLFSNYGAEAALKELYELRKEMGINTYSSSPEPVEYAINGLIKQMLMKSGSISL